MVRGVGRSFAKTGSSAYRYGFNGKENDKDISEGGQDYGMRISDSRLGRFLSVDPITAKYPELTPYQFASNRPIDAIDLDGLEAKSVTAQPSGHYHSTVGSPLGYKSSTPIRPSTPDNTGASYFRIVDANDIKMFIRVTTSFKFTTSIWGNTVEAKENFEYFDQKPGSNGANYPGFSWVPYKDDGQARFEQIENTTNDIKFGTRALVFGGAAIPAAVALAPAFMSVSSSYGSFMAVNFTKGSITAGLDVTAQYLGGINEKGYGRNNWGSINLTSPVANLLTGGNTFIAPIISTLAPITYNKGLDKNNMPTFLGGNKNIVSTTYNIASGIGCNLLGDKVGNSLIKNTILKKNAANNVSTVAGGVVGNTVQTIVGNIVEPLIK